MFGEDIIKIFVAVIIIAIVVGVVFLIDANNWGKAIGVAQTSVGNQELILSLRNKTGNDLVITSVTIRVKPYGKSAFTYTFKPDRFCYHDSSETFVLPYSEIYRGDTAKVESFKVTKVKYANP